MNISEFLLHISGSSDPIKIESLKIISNDELNEHNQLDDNQHIMEVFTIHNNKNENEDSKTKIDVDDIEEFLKWFNEIHFNLSVKKGKYKFDCISHINSNHYLIEWTH